MKVYKHNRQKVYHTDLDCTAIGRNPIEKDLDVLEDHYEPCSICVKGEHPQADVGGYEVLAAKLNRMEPDEI